MNETSKNTRQQSPFPPWLIIGVWIALSSSVILFNREIMMGAAQFKYPVTLTTLHLAFQTVATRLLHRYTDLISPIGSSTPSSYELLPTTEPKEGGSAHGSASGTEMSSEDLKRAKALGVEMDWKTWRSQILPPAFLFSVSLVLSNWAYLFISTAYIHMLKAFSPVAILLAAFIFGTKAFSVKLVLIVLIISLGVGLASYGEAAFNLTGFFIQFVAILVEATRVTLIQILLQGSKQMSPLKTLYFFAPICFLMNASMIVPLEGLEAIRAIPDLGFLVIFGNCVLTFALNVSAVYLIALSSMALSLSKVVKDIMLVGGSALLLGDSLSFIQVAGYLIATAGLLWYKTTS